MKKAFTLLLIASYLFATSGCGVLFYPERQGQKQGKIDPVVAILDGVGLIFFVVPGLVAFAVDFHQGTIYLPHSKASRFTSSELEDSEVIKLTERPSKSSIEQAVKDATGKQIDLKDSAVQAFDMSLLQNGSIPVTAGFGHSIKG